MAKTDWNASDVVQPSHLNEIGEEIIAAAAAALAAETPAGAQAKADAAATASMQVALDAISASQIHKITNNEGRGLNIGSSLTTSLNEYIESGIYAVETGAANAPQGTGNGVLEVIRRSAGWCFHRFTTAHSTNVPIRVYVRQSTNANNYPSHIWTDWRRVDSEVYGAVDASGWDFDTMLTPGFYTGGNITHSPRHPNNNLWWYIEIYGWASAGVVMQKVTLQSNSRVETWVRNRSGSIWSQWRRLDGGAGTVLQGYSEGLIVTGTTGTVTLNVFEGNIFRLNPSGNCTIAFSNVPPSTVASITLIIVQGATARTITLPASVKWANGAVPTLNVSNATHVISMFTIDSGITWLASYAGGYA